MCGSIQTKRRIDMHKLSKICKNPKHLFVFQTLLLKKQIEAHGGQMVFVHKYLVKIELNNEKYFVKVNLLDNEFYVFSSKDTILFFQSFNELKIWLKTILPTGGETDDPI